MLDEERPGSYRLTPPVGAPTPAVIATLAGWLAERDLALGDLRTGQSLEEAYLAITGSRGDVDPPDDGDRGPAGESSGEGGSQVTAESASADGARPAGTDAGDDPGDRGGAAHPATSGR